MDDHWAISNFGALDFDSASDADLDGMSNLEEFQAGANPNQSASRLHLTSVHLNLSGFVQIRWAAVPGRAYRIQARDNLVSAPWQNLTDPIIAATPDSTVALPFPPPSTEAYFRVFLEN